MKRKLTDLTTWPQYQKKLLKNKAVKTESDKIEYQYQLVKNLIDLRLKQKLSQHDLAIKIGSKQPVISRLETGSQKPSLALLERLATALNHPLTITINP